MKKTLILAALVFLFSMPEAIAASVGARLDDGCHFHSGTLVVPQGKTAVNLRMDISSSWLTCTAPGTVTRIGGRLVGPSGSVLYYRVQYGNGKSEVLAGSLDGLTLAPGTYTVEVRDGGRGTGVALNYDLTSAPPPPPPVVSTVSGSAGAWGSIGGDWTDPSVKSNAKIAQAGESISITNSFVWEGKTITWLGSGTISGDEVRFNFRYTSARPEGWEDGSMVLTRTNRKTLSGKWTTASGKYSNPITFIQTRSDDPEALPASGKPPRGQKPNEKPDSPREVHKQNAPPSRSIVCPPGQIYEETLGCTPYLREKEER